MRAILIDPWERSLSEIDVGEGDDEIKKALQCDDITLGSIERITSAAGDRLLLLVDKSYLQVGYMVDRDNPPVWFTMDADRVPPTTSSIPVLGVLIGLDENGYHNDAKISLEELTRRITFMQRPKDYDR
jgi:hypothetical protein